MKKIISVIAIFSILFLTIFSTNIYAASLDAIDVTTDKQTVHPGENIKVNIDFGQELGSYTFDIAYDNNLLEYVSAEGGTANDNGTRVRVYFFDSTGGSAPRSNMSVTFKAKDDILTSNPTNFSITAEGLANSDASVTYDDINIPIVKDVIVEPKYVDYTISLDYTGDVIKDKEKDMKLVVASSMGKNYEHVRLLAEATSPNGGSVKLLATDSQNLEHDIIQSGWGDASGYSIGGKDVKQELNVRGLFTETGTYSITFKLVDRDNSDAEIATKTVQVTVKSEETVTPPQEEMPEEKPEETVKEETKKEEEPNELPKTGNTAYVLVGSSVVLLATLFVLLRKKD